MDSQYFSKPLSLRQITITDPFWKQEMELVRKEVIPYQWKALNDQVEGAAPSFCMRNFKIAGKMNQKKAVMGEQYEEPKYTFRGFEALPEDPEHLEDRFYGFVFQDSDFSKWIEAVAYSLTQYPDPELEKVADEAIEIVCNAQQEDGYLDTYYIINGKDKIFTNLRDHHELYCFGHLAEGAVAYYQATGKDRLLQAAERFADYIAEYFGPLEHQCKGYPGHEIAEMALARLYEVTGKESYLELGRFFVEQRGKRPYYFDSEGHERIPKEKVNELRYQYQQAHLPVREQKEAVGHAVRAVYLYSGMADVARLTEDQELFDACEKLWESITRRKMYITGGIGATHIGEAFSFDYDLPNDTAYAETCASIGLVFFARRMLEMKPDAKYADVMELALYNGVLSGMAMDGKSFFYVNPLEVYPKACREDGRKAHVKAVRQKWFGCACCPPNLARMVSSVGAYAYTENQDTLLVHLYAGGKIQKEIAGRMAQVELESQFPWEGRAKITVQAQGTTLRLALRIPGWCEEFDAENIRQQLSTAGDTVRLWIDGGYLYIQKKWQEKEEIELDFPMKPKFEQADLRVRENIGKLALKRGPVVYCMEEVDNGSNLHLTSIRKDAPICTEQREIAGSSLLVLRTVGTRISPAEEERELYCEAAEVKKVKTELIFIPYFAWANRGENEMQVWIREEDFVLH